MESESSKIVPFPKDPASRWIDTYHRTYLVQRSDGTVAVYMGILRHFTQWIVERAGKRELFHPELLTTRAIERYLSDLDAHGYSFSHRKRAKSVITHFCQWLVDDPETPLLQNPARGITLARPSRQARESSPRILSPTQRVLIRALVKKGDVRGHALFALAYWAGCRVTDITHLQIEHTHVGAKSGWLHLGTSAGQVRDIDLMNEARRPLYTYLQQRGCDERSPYVFPSQRSSRLSEAGLHHWFRTLKQRATPEEWEQISTISFHDLRHDFAHRALEAGWTLEELAYYLGHVTLKGTPALQTTVRYTQVARAQVKEKLKAVKG
jgi:site-specific recombinase XerD